MSQLNKKWGVGKVGALAACGVAVLALTLSNPLPEPKAPALGEGPSAVEMMKTNLKETYASMASLWNGASGGLSTEIKSAISYKRSNDAWDEQEGLRVATLGVFGAERYGKDQQGGATVVIKHANGMPLVSAAELASGKASRSQAILGAMQTSLNGAREVMLMAPPSDDALSLDKARLYHLAALGHAVIKGQPHLNITAIPGVNKSISSMPEGQRKGVSTARAEALRAFKIGFVEAMVSLSSPEQAKSFALPSPQTLNDFGMKTLTQDQVKQIGQIKTKFGGDSSWGVVEGAIAYATAASRSAYDQTLKNPKTATAGLPAYSKVPVRIYAGSDLVDADSMKTSPSAALRVSLALKRQGTGLVNEIRIKSGEGHIKALSVEAFRKAREEAAGVVAAEKKIKSSL